MPSHPHIARSALLQQHPSLHAASCDRTSSVLFKINAAPKGVLGIVKAGIVLYVVCASYGTSERLGIAATTSAIVDSAYATDLVYYVRVVTAMLIPLCVAAGVVVFVVGAIRLITRGADVRERARGKKNMLWGMLGLCLAVSVWGIVALLTNLLGIDTVARPPLPGTPVLLR